MVKVNLKGEVKDFEMLIIAKNFLYGRREDNLELILETDKINLIIIDEIEDD